MAELEKIARVIKKLDASAPHAVLLVLDATTGQNALSQVEAFKAAGAADGADHDQAGRHRQRRHTGGAGGDDSRCRCISSAWAKARMTCSPSTPQAFAKRLRGRHEIRKFAALRSIWGRCFVFFMRSNIWEFLPPPPSSWLRCSSPWPWIVVWKEDCRPCRFSQRCWC